MGKLSRRQFLGLVGGSAVASALAACAPAQAPAPPAPTAPSGPRGEVTILQGVDANTLDPDFRNSVPEFNINAHIFDMFLWRDPKTLEPKPWIISEWRNVDDLTWEFKLVQGAKFHDGTPVDAEAAKFSIERHTKERVGGKPIVPALRRLINFDRVEVVDRYTFRVKTTAPAATILDELTSYEIMPPSVYADESADNLAKVAAKPVGSGPYKFVEWVKDQRLVMEANPDYWGPKPQIQRLIWRPVAELSTRILALQRGEADVIVNVAPDQMANVERSGNARICRIKGGRNIFVGIRCDRPYLSDKRVRQALNYAVNFDAINRAILGGIGERTKTIVTRPSEQPPNAKPYPYDPDRARQLLKEAGVPEGFKVVMDSPNGRYIKDKEIAQAIAQDLQRVGLQVELKVLDWALYAGDMLAKRQPDDLFFLGLGSPFNAQAEFNYIHPDFSLNSTYWVNQDFIRLYDELRRTLDRNKRQQIINRLWEIAYDDPPWVYVWQQVDIYGVSNRLEWECRPDERILLHEARLRS